MAPLAGVAAVVSSSSSALTAPGVEPLRMPGVEPFRIGYGEAVCESVPTSLDSSASFASRSAVASWAADSEALCVGNSHSNGGCQSMARGHVGRVGYFGRARTSAMPASVALITHEL